MMDMAKIEEISKGIDEHLRKLESFTSVLREVKMSLEIIKDFQQKSFLYELSTVKRDITTMADQLRKHGLPQATDYEKAVAEIRSVLDSNEWPMAIDPSFICDTEDKRHERANSILDMMVAENLSGKKVLDFGCGEGHVIPAAMSREASLALGYDLDASKYKFDKNYFTDSFEIVKQNAPYDVIIIHDVLDHIIAIDPIDAMRQTASILSNSGRIYVRNHPWCSRHGGHLYLQKNKAFLHLIMDDVELVRCGGYQSDHNIKITTPLETYRFWFAEAGLQVKSELPCRTPVEDFFIQPSVIRDRINQHWKNPEAVQNNLQIDFVEYVLELKEPTANCQIF